MTPKPITAPVNRSRKRDWIGSDRRYDGYNRSFLNRIKDIMDPSFLINWRSLIGDKNRGKRRHPFNTLNFFITFLVNYVYSTRFLSGH